VNKTKLGTRLFEDLLVRRNMVNWMKDITGSLMLVLCYWRDARI